MAEIRDVNPPHPIWPTRPAQDRDRRTPQRPGEPAAQNDDDQTEAEKDRKDDDHQIDEYA